MFNPEDLHPETGKYRHILVPKDTKSVKVKFKDGQEAHDELTPPPKKKNPLAFRTYRDVQQA